MAGGGGEQERRMDDALEQRRHKETHQPNAMYRSCLTLT